MKKNRTRMMLSTFVIFLILFSISNVCLSSEPTNFSTNPIKKNNSTKWRIGYLDAGPYPDYQGSVIATVKGLMELGWVKESPIPKLPDNKDVEVLWKWMATDLKSDYIEFVADAFYTSNWEKEKRPITKEAVIKRLTTKKDIDLMLGLGTWGGQDLANDEHSVPTIVASTTNPIDAQIVKSVQDSGRDHIMARLDPERYLQQVRLFHEIIGFKNLGLIYENTPQGRSLASIDDVEKVAKELGFTIVPCNVQFNDPSFDQVVKCFETISPKVDAIYITRYKESINEHMQRIMPFITKSQIPTFSQVGSIEVKHGVLFSISQSQFKYVGKFYAESIAKIFNGAKPRQLNQVFQSPPKIAINLATAQIIGYDPSIDILGAADEIYNEIEVYKKP
ncbi:MAG: ABC transporter substrate-binding protein [Desulfobacterales bacterium]|nr:ABC transporter substrate-binding protein [Desulfobacterales bacterium]